MKCNKCKLKLFNIFLCFTICSFSFFFQCAYEKTYLSYETIERLELTVDEIKAIQFYLGDTIILQKIDETVEKEVTADRRILATEEEASRSFILQKGMPVVVVKIVKPWVDVDMGNEILLRFELGTGMSYVRFMNNQKLYNEGEIDYQGQKYRVIFPEGIPTLDLNIDSYQQKKWMSEKAQGQSVK